MRCLVLAMVLAACSTGGKGGPVVPGALAVLPASLPQAVAGTFYSVTLLAAGGTGTGYQWRLVSGTLPSGVAGLPASGPTAMLAGTPGAAGSSGFTVELRDSAGATVTIGYTLVVGSGVPGPGGGGTSLLNAPAPRGFHTAVWTGSEMIVWGGLDFTGVKGTGGAYDPANDRWRTLATAGAPAARFAHTAVWTGAEMIVWGGSDAQGALGTGGAYDPGTDTWRALSTAGAPERRVLHSAVWTGTEMIVWGGEGVFAPPAPNSVDKVFADGFAYDPVADNWSPVSAAGPPASRSHTAVWTGVEMVVWGGRDGFALTLSTQNTGGAYDPVADVWTATDTSTAPTARMSHTAVWTGTEMIVWGGRETTAPAVRSGGRLAGGSWSATSTAGAPSGRAGHVAVWTGTEMIVWGGSGSTGLVGDGAAYDPATSTWRAFAAGTPRADHTAVWTGTSMIVWGGHTSPADTYLDTGFVLTP